jgi:hypothetical protein
LNDEDTKSMKGKGVEEINDVFFLILLIFLSIRWAG